jgi:hypothetical protein
MTKSTTALLLSVSALLAVHKAHARTNKNTYEEKGTTLKFQGGMTFSKMDWKAYSEEQLFKFSVPGLYCSAGLDYCDRRRFNISSNIGYIRKGGLNKYMITDPTGIGFKSDHLKLDYITFNTSFDYKILADRFATPYLSVAPRIDYLAHYSKELLRNLDEHNNLNRVGLGLNVGLGVKYSVERIELGLRADYLFNFSKVGTFTNELTKTLSTVNDKTYMVSLTCGYHLRRQ